MKRIMSTIQNRPPQYRLTRQALRRTTIVLFLSVSLGGVASLEVRAQALSEYRVKAAFILNFARFIEWPSDGYGEGGALVVGIVGDDPFGGSLDQLSGNTVNGHRIVIKRLRAGTI
jgi:hypothetical protein